MSWDISDAFFHVPLSPVDQRRLAFRVGNRVFLPLVLPFGMKLSPYVFTKVMRPVVAAVSLRGMRMPAYLDDFASTAAGAAPSTKPAATAARACALALLGRLGFAVHPLKGAATGTTSLPLLEFVLDTERRLILLPPSRQAAVMTAVRVSLVGGRGGFSLVVCIRFRSAVGTIVVRIIVVVALNLQGGDACGEPPHWQRLLLIIPEQVARVDPRLGEQPRRKPVDVRRVVRQRHVVDDLVHVKERGGVLIQVLVLLPVRVLAATAAGAERRKR